MAADEAGGGSLGLSAIALLCPPRPLAKVGRRRKSEPCPLPEAWRAVLNLTGRAGVRASGPKF